MLVLGLVGLLGWDVIADCFAPTLDNETCHLDGQGSGLCVQHRVGRAGLHDPEEEVWFVWVQADVPSSRITYSPWPFLDAGGVETSIVPDGVTMTSDGVSVTYPADFYELN